MRTLLLAGLAFVAFNVSVQAQQPFVSKPIDADKLIVKPGDTLSGVTAGASTNIFRRMTRAVAGTVESNGFVKTVNNLLGRRAAPEPTMQNGYSPLPAPNTFRSTQYPNSVVPMVPKTQQFGRSPNIIMPATPSANR